jgi:hypothetical protein
MSKILLLRGWFSSGSAKHGFLNSLGFHVKNPILSDLSFKSAVNIAQQAADEFQPDLIIGASRGGAVAMNIESDCPMILMCPAYKFFGNKRHAKDSFLIHSQNDDIIPYAHSVELASLSKLPLYTGGKDHRLSCGEAQQILKQILQQTIGLPNPIVLESNVLNQPTN